MMRQAAQVVGSFFTVVLICIMYFQVVQTIRAADLDNFANGKFSFYVPTENQFNSSFMVKDNGGKVSMMTYSAFSL